MKKLLCLLALFVSLSFFAQQRAVEITNITTGKTKIFEENQRVKIRTLDHKKHVGSLKFVDDQTIIVGTDEIKIETLASIKAQSKTLSTIKTIVLVTGVAILGTSIVVASGGGNAAFLLFTTGAGVTIAGGILEGLNLNNTKRNWTFKIIEK